MTFVNTQVSTDTDPSDRTAKYKGLNCDQEDQLKQLLVRYFEIGWKIANRLEHEGRLDEVLTIAGVNPTVKRPQSSFGPSYPLVPPKQ